MEKKRGPKINPRIPRYILPEGSRTSIVRPQFVELVDPQPVRAKPQEGLREKRVAEVPSTVTSTSAGVNAADTSSAEPPSCGAGCGPCSGQDRGGGPSGHGSRGDQLSDKPGIDNLEQLLDMAVRIQDETS